MPQQNSQTLQLSAKTGQFSPEILKLGFLPIFAHPVT